MVNSENGYGTNSAVGWNSRNAWAKNCARQLYQRVSAQNWMSDLWRVVRGRPHRLLDLATVQQECAVQGYKQSGLQKVSVSQIKGSCTGAKCADFDVTFRPLSARSQTRWESVATALNLGRKLPPVELVQLGEIFFVTDGHHRVSVVQAMGMQTIEARVTVLELAA